MTGPDLESPWGSLSATPRRKVSWGTPPGVEDRPAPRSTTSGQEPSSSATNTAEGSSVTEPDHKLTATGGQEAPMTTPPENDLADLFGDRHPAPPPAQAPDAPQSTDPDPAAQADTDGQDLSDLFGPNPATMPPAEADSTPQTEPEPVKQSAQEGQDCDRGETELPAAADVASLFANPPAPAPDPDPQTTPVAADLSAVFGPAAAAAQDEPTTDKGGASDTAAAVPTNPFASAAHPFGTPPPAADSPDGDKPTTTPAPATAAGRVAAQRAAIDAARAATPSLPRMHAHTEALARDERFTRAAEVAPWVDQLLGLGSSGDPAIQSFLRRMELTRDHQLDRQQRAEYQSLLEPRLAQAGIQLQSADDARIIFDIAYDELLGIGPLGPLWRDDTVTEIMVSGPDKVTIEREGKLELTPVTFHSLEHLERTARQLGSRSADDRAISATNPLVTIQLPRARVQFVWRPLAVNKVAIAIRKFGDLLGMDALMAGGSLSTQMHQFLAAAVAARATVLVSGGTGSGKTTFINALSEFIPDTERVITIEDALELQLRNTHVEALVTKEAASADDQILFGQEQLLKASLRMRPDRIIVGEIRDGKGCAVMLEAANTGHSGTMTTIHANSPSLALARMATLVRRVDAMPDDVARAEVASAIDVVTQVVRTRGRRFVSSVAVVDKHTGEAVPIFEGDYPAGAPAPVFRRVGGIGTDTDLAMRMVDAGIDPSPWEE